MDSNAARSAQQQQQQHQQQQGLDDNNSDEGCKRKSFLQHFSFTFSFFPSFTTFDELWRDYKKVLFSPQLFL
jgi:hypothetical protein